MILRRLVLSAVFLASACVSAPTTDPAELPAGDWTLDDAHTQVIWRARHMGLSWYVGRFDEAEASLVFDPAAPENAALTAIVRADSISTGDADFDARLSRWLGAARHPEIVFRSTRIEVTGERTGRVHGDLSLNGITQPAVMETEFYGGVQNPLEGRRALGFGAELVVDRTAFDVSGLGSNFVGTEVRLRIEAEFLEAED